MAFMQVNQGGNAAEFLPILSYKANHGRLYLRDRAQNAIGDWEATETDVTKQEPAFAVDFGTLEMGWCLFVKGAAALWTMAYVGQPEPPKPASPGKDTLGKDLDFKRGFRVRVAGKDIGGIREFAGNSNALCGAMNDLHTQFEKAPEAAQGKIPLVKMTDVVTVKVGQSTNFQPVFTIQAWVDRPDALGPRMVPAPQASLPLSRMSPQGAAAMANASMRTGTSAANTPQAKTPDAMPF